MPHVYELTYEVNERIFHRCLGQVPFAAHAGPAAGVALQPLHEHLLHHSPYSDEKSPSTSADAENSLHSGTAAWGGPADSNPLAFSYLTVCDEAELLRRYREALGPYLWACEQLGVDGPPQLVAPSRCRRAMYRGIAAISYVFLALVVVASGLDTAQNGVPAVYHLSVIVIFITGTGSVSGLLYGRRLRLWRLMAFTLATSSPVQRRTILIYTRWAQRVTLCLIVFGAVTSFVQTPLVGLDSEFLAVVFRLLTLGVDSTWLNGVVSVLYSLILGPAVLCAGLLGGVTLLLTVLCHAVHFRQLAWIMFERDARYLAVHPPISSASEVASPRARPGRAVVDSGTRKSRANTGMDELSAESTIKAHNSVQRLSVAHLYNHHRVLYAMLSHTSRSLQWLSVLLLGSWTLLVVVYFFLVVQLGTHSSQLPFELFGFFFVSCVLILMLRALSLPYQDIVALREASAQLMSLTAAERRDLAVYFKVHQTGWTIFRAPVTSSLVLRVGYAVATVFAYILQRSTQS